MSGKKTIVKNKWSSDLSKTEIEDLIKLFENSLTFIIQSHNANTFNNHEIETVHILCLIYFMISISRDQEFCYLIFSDWYNSVRSRSCFHCKKNMFLSLIENDHLNEFGISIDIKHEIFNKFDGFSKLILKSDNLEVSDQRDIFALLYNIIIIDLNENSIPPLLLDSDEIHDIKYFKLYDNLFIDNFGRSYMMLYYHFQDLKRDLYKSKKRKFDNFNNNSVLKVNTEFDIEDIPPCLSKMKNDCKIEKRHPKDLERLFFISIMKDFCDEKMMLEIASKFEYDNRSNSKTDDIHALKTRIKAYFKNMSIANYGCNWAYKNNLCAFSNCSDESEALKRCHENTDKQYMKPKDFVTKKLENKKSTH